MSNRKYIRRNKVRKSKTQVRKYKGNPNRFKLRRTQLPENFKLAEYFELDNGVKIKSPEYSDIKDLPLPSGRGGGIKGGNDLFNLSCHDEPDTSNWNIVYSQAGWCYAQIDFPPIWWPLNFYTTIGDVYIGDELTTNPMACNLSAPSQQELECECWDNCMFAMGLQDTDNIFQHCLNECNDLNDCHESGWINWPSEYIECTHQSSCQNDVEKICKWKQYIPFPNYNNNYFNDATGNADAIAIMYNGTIVGMDYINNILEGDAPGELDTPIGGIMIPVSNQENVPNFPGYPSHGQYIDDLLLFRASTQTYHRLTDESYDEYFNGDGWYGGNGNLPPIDQYGGFGVKYMDLVFNPQPYEGPPNFTLSLHSGENLISFPIELDNSSLDAVFEDERITKVIGEGVAATRVNGVFQGSLNEVDTTSSYYVNALEDLTLEYMGEPSGLFQSYDIHVGNNYVAFPHLNCKGIRGLINPQYHGVITNIMGEGVAATYINGEYEGSLQQVCPGDGLIIFSNEAFVGSVFAP
jgi:hypothetical protein